MDQAHPFANLHKSLDLNGKSYKYYDMVGLKDARIQKLPFSVRVLLESAIRNCDNFSVKTSDVETILDWEKT